MSDDIFIVSGSSRSTASLGSVFLFTLLNSKFTFQSVNMGFRNSKFTLKTVNIEQ